MKKKIIKTLVGLMLIVLLVGTYSVFKPKKETNLTTVKLAEVTHSVFYAPLYVAIENGYMKEEGLDIDLLLTPGADKVSAAVLSGDVLIGFAGAESTIYVYDGGEKDYLVTFAGLTKRDGQFIFGKDENFDWHNLEGKEVLVGRKGGMPALNFINATENAGVDISKVNLNYSVEFAALSGSYISGVGDYVNLFEPNASLLEKEGYGKVLASIGSLSGEMPYTAFYTKKSSLENDEDTLKKFTKAINKGLKYCEENDALEIAKSIKGQFKDSNINDLETFVKRYKESDSWLKDTYIKEEYFKNLEDLLIKNKLITKYVPYNDLIKNLNE